MNELIEKIIFDETLSSEEKTILINRTVNASHGIDRFLTEGVYLHSEENKETNRIDIELWYRNVDPSGMTYHANTNYDQDAILEFMKKTCISKGLKK